MLKSHLPNVIHCNIQNNKIQPRDVKTVSISILRWVGCAPRTRPSWRFTPRWWRTTRAFRCRRTTSARGICTSGRWKRRTAAATCVRSTPAWWRSKSAASTCTVSVLHSPTQSLSGLSWVGWLDCHREKLMLWRNQLIRIGAHWHVCVCVSAH